ncbi:MAG: hypothetical protein WC872_02665 [Candidatus Absconditabacterales bacterium]
MLISPYGYNFNFAGIVLGIFLRMVLFFKKIKRIENRKVRADILFFSFCLCIVPLGIFLLMGDNFIGNTTNGIFGIKSLHSESQLNKFSSVLPIGLFLTITSLLVAGCTRIFRKIKKKFGYGILGFAMLLFVINIILLFQQYPRHGVISIGNITLDIKQYVSFFIIMFCLYLHHKRTIQSTQETEEDNIIPY